MKVAYLLSTFPKLSESFILNEIVELLKSGHDVQIFSMYTPMGDVTHEEVKKYNLSEKTHYFRLNQIVKVNSTKLLKYFLKALIQDLYNLKISKSILKLNLKLAYFAAIMDAHDVELIHAHFADMGGAARKLSRMLGVPYTLTAHAFEIFINPDIEMLKQYINDAAQVFTPSEYNKQYLIDLTMCRGNKVKIIHATIDPEKFVKTKKCNTEELIMAARLVEKKGMGYMIKAMKDIAMQHPEAVLKVIGDGPFYNDLKNLVRGYNLEKNVKFFGSISDEEYYNELDASVAAVLPCIIAKNGDRDVCPLTLQEAMSMKLPVVSTNVHSIPELIDDGVSGILVPPKNEKALADAVIKLLNDPELRNRMGENGRKKIMGEFNVELQVDKQIRLWQEVLK